MTVSAIFRKYPKEIIKKPVLDESSFFYKEVVGPCLARNQANPTPGLIQEIVHIPKEKLSYNDLLIFLSFCKQGGLDSIANGSQFFKELISQTLKENNEELFLILLEIENKEQRCSSGALNQKDLDNLLCIAVLEKGWDRSVLKLAEMGADVNQKDENGANLLHKAFTQGPWGSEDAFNSTSHKAALLIAAGALIEPENRGFISNSFLQVLGSRLDLYGEALQKILAQDPSAAFQQEIFGEEDLATWFAEQFIQRPDDSKLIKLFEQILENKKNIVSASFFSESSRITMTDALTKAFQTDQAALAEKIADSNLTEYPDRSRLFKIAIERESLASIEMCLRWGWDSSLIDTQLLDKLTSGKSIFGKNGEGKELFTLVARLFYNNSSDKEMAKIFERLIDQAGQIESPVVELFSDALIGAFWECLKKGRLDLAFKIIRTKLISPSRKQQWLEWAASNGCIPLIEECIKLGADPYEMNDFDRNIFDSVVCGDAREKEELLFSLFNLSSKFYPVNPNMARKILRRDETFSAWNNSRDKSFLSLIASRFLKDPSDKEFVDLLEKLMENAVTNESFLYMLSNRSDTLQYFTKLLDSAIQTGHSSLAVKIIRTRKVDLNYLQSWLNAACAKGLYSTVEECLKIGANPYTTDNDFLNGFHNVALGSSNEKQKLFALLQQYKKDSHDPDRYGYSPIVLMHMGGYDCSSLLTKKEEDLIHKKIAGHVSSTPNCSAFSYEGSVPQAMPQEISESLADFFQDEREEPSRDVREKLVEVFQAGAKAIDPDAVSARIKRGEPTLVLGGWPDHCIVLAFMEDPFGDIEKGDAILAVCNRGNGANAPIESILAFRINCKKFTPAMAREIAMGVKKWDRDKALAHHYQELPKALSNDGNIIQDDFCRMLQQELFLSLQKLGHCTYDSPKAALRFFWAMMLFKGQREKTKEIAAQVKQKAKRWSLLAHVHRLEIFAARFPHQKVETVPADEAHYLKNAHAKITKRLNKVNVFQRAKDRFESVVSKHPLLKIC